MKKTYAKLEEGNLIYPPNGIEKADGTWVIPPTEDLLIEEGYKEVIFADQPEPRENYIIRPIYTEAGDKILESWTETYVEPQYSLEERIKITEDALLEIGDMLASLSEEGE